VDYAFKRKQWSSHSLLLEKPLPEGRGVVTVSALLFIVIAAFFVFHKW